MRLVLLVVSVALVAVGCGSKHDAIVGIRALDLGGSGTLVAVAQARANGRQAPLESIAPLIPRRLPRATVCAGRAVVVIVFASGKRVRYGSCDLPASIRTLQLALTGEVRQWSAAPTPTTRIAGGTGRERAALGRVLRRLGQTRIRSVRLEPNVGPVTLRVDAGPALRGQWESSLLADLYAAEADRLGMRTVAYVASNGGTWSPGAVGGASISLTTVRDVIASAGAQIVELRHQAGAVAVTLRTEHPAAFLKHHGRGLVMALRPKSSFDLTSVYVGVQDGAGALVYAWGWLPAQGMFWTRPDLDACGPISHSMPVGARELPCAATA